MRRNGSGNSASPRAMPKRPVSRAPSLVLSTAGPSSSGPQGYPPPYHQPRGPPSGMPPRGYYGFPPRPGPPPRPVAYAPKSVWSRDPYGHPGPQGAMPGPRMGGHHAEGLYNDRGVRPFRSLSPNSFDDDSAMDEALAAAVEPIPLKRQAVGATSSPSLVPPGQPSAPSPASFASPITGGDGTLPVTPSVAPSSAPVPVFVPPSPPQGSHSTGGGGPQSGETLRLRRELDHMRALLQDREGRLQSLSHRLQLAENESCDVRASHAAEKEEARLAVKRIREESIKDIQHLQSVLGFKSQELVEADHRKRSLELKLERYRRKFSSMLGDGVMGFEATQAPMTQGMPAQSSQPSTPKASTPKPASQPLPPVVVEAPARAAEACGHETAPHDKTTPSTTHPSTSSRSRSSGSSLGGHDPKTQALVRVLDALFVHGGRELSVLLHCQPQACLPGECKRCQGEHTHAPCPSLADCIHSVIAATAGGSDAAPRIHTTGSSGHTHRVQALVTCLADFAGLCGSNSATETASGPVGPVCGVCVPCGVCDPVRTAALQLLTRVFQAYPLLLHASPAATAPSSNDMTLKTASNSKLGPWQCNDGPPMFGSCVRLAPSATPQLALSQPTLSKAFRRLDAPPGPSECDRASQRTVQDVLTSAVTAVVALCAGLVSSAGSDPVSIATIARPCSGLLAFLQCVAALGSDTSHALPSLCRPLLTSRCMAALASAASQFIAEGLQAKAGCDVTSCVPAVCELCCAAIDLLTDVCLKLTSDQFRSQYDELSDAFKWLCALLVAVPVPSTAHPDWLSCVGPHIPCILALHRSASRLMAAVLMYHGRVGVAALCCLPVPTHDGPLALPKPPPPVSEFDFEPDVPPPVPDAACFACSSAVVSGPLHTCALVGKSMHACLLPAMVAATHQLCMCACEVALLLADLPGSLFEDVCTTIRQCVNVISTVCVAVAGGDGIRLTGVKSLLGRPSVLSALAGVVFRLGAGGSLQPWFTNCDTPMFLGHLEGLLAKTPDGSPKERR